MDRCFFREYQTGRPLFPLSDDIQAIDLQIGKGSEELLEMVQARRHHLVANELSKVIQVLFVVNIVYITANYGLIILSNHRASLTKQSEEAGSF